MTIKVDLQAFLFYFYEVKMELNINRGDYMGKILVIAEKPQVGKMIAAVAGCSQMHEGYIEGDKYIVSWAIGHLIELADPQDYDIKFKKWVIEDLPILPEQMKLKVSTKTRGQYKVLRDLIKLPEIECLICATDAGREGELIFRYIYSMTGTSLRLLCMRTVRGLCALIRREP